MIEGFVALRQGPCAFDIPIL